MAVVLRNNVVKSVSVNVTPPVRERSTHFNERAALFAAMWESHDHDVQTGAYSPDGDW